MDPHEMLAAAQTAYDKGNPGLALSYLYNCASWRIAGGYEPEGWPEAVRSLWCKVDEQIPQHGVRALSIAA